MQHVWFVISVLHALLLNAAELDVDNNLLMHAPYSVCIVMVEWHEYQSSCNQCAHDMKGDGAVQQARHDLPKLRQASMDE